MDHAWTSSEREGRERLSLLISLHCDERKKWKGDQEFNWRGLNQIWERGGSRDLSANVSEPSVCIVAKLPTDAVGPEVERSVKKGSEQKEESGKTAGT